MESILNTSKNQCYSCHASGNTELHRIIFGSGMRKISDDNGLTCYLCPECHRGTDGVHGKNGDELNRILKKEVQEAYEAIHGHEAWMKLIGRNYID